MMKVINCKQGDPDWFEARLGIPTASEFSRIVTPKRFGYAFDSAQTYINELICERLYPGYNFGGGYTSLDMDRGTHMEPETRRWYEFEHDCKVMEVGLCLTDDGRFGASPDGLVGEELGIEIKCPNPRTMLQWVRKDVIPAEHLAQMHGGMIVTQRRKWDFFAYYPGPPPLTLLKHLEWNEQTDFMVVALEKFWEDYQEALGEIQDKEIVMPTRTVDCGELGTIEESVHSPSYF